MANHWAATEITCRGSPPVASILIDRGLPDIVTGLNRADERDLRAIGRPSWTNVVRRAERGAEPGAPELVVGQILQRARASIEDPEIAFVQSRRGSSVKAILVLSGDQVYIS